MKFCNQFSNNVIVGSLIELPSLSIPLSLVSETIPDVLDAVAVRTLIIFQNQMPIE